MKRSWLPFLVVVAVSACRSGGPAASSTPPVPVPTATIAAPLRPLPEAIRWVRDSAEHCAIFLQTYREAARYVEQEAGRHSAGTWAVVLDADETVLDNSEYSLERASAGLPFDSASWHAWTRRRAATPLPGAAWFLAQVRALGGRIAIVTNRAASECPDTEAVFKSDHLDYDVMLCMPDHGPSDKNPRFQAVAKGTTPAGLPPLEIVAFLGDNILDFPEQSQAIRDQGDEAFAQFGSRFFVLPNPMYGSWD